MLTAVLLYVFSILVTGSMAIAATYVNTHATHTHVTDSANLSCHTDSSSIRFHELLDTSACQDSVDDGDCSFCAQVQFSVPGNILLFTPDPGILTRHETLRLTSLGRTPAYRPPKIIH